MGVARIDDFDPTPSPTPAVALTIAGSDSGGSAGLAADLRSFAANGVHGVFALTLVTAQNSTGILGAEPLAPTLIASQIDALTSDFTIGSTKTGMLFTEEAVDVVASRVSELGPLVVDPVLVASSGKPLFDDRVTNAYIDRLFPVAVLVTPNVAEAALLTGLEITTRTELLEASRRLLDLGPKAALITGFHEGDNAVDAFAADGQVQPLEHPLIATSNVLGTGCSLSSAIAAHLASGDTLQTSIDVARKYVHDGLRSSSEWRLGAGQGPIDHLAQWPGLR